MAAWLPASWAGAFCGDIIFSDQEQTRRLKRKLEVT